jgi:L-fucose mutarotase
VLKGIDPLLGPDLLWILAAMGHGDDLALVDANHPAETIASATTSGRLVRLPGVSLERAAAAILSVLPLDDFEDDPLRRMEVVGSPGEMPEAQRAVLQACEAATGRTVPAAGLERFAFYAAARRAFAVVQVGDLRPYGCFLLRKGVLGTAGDRPGQSTGPAAE